MKTKVRNLVVVVLLACSEPHDFEIVNTAVNVVDAKISNLIGRSYIDIYQNLASGKIYIQDLNVALVTDQNDVIPFIYDPGENSYRPLDENFVADSDLEYRMVASGQNEIIYESSFERIEPPVNFKFAIKDTTLFDRQVDGITGVAKEARAFVARLPPNLERAYLKFDFKYSYADFFTGDTTTREFLDESVLFTSVGINQTSDSIEIPLRVKTFTGWFFTDRSIPAFACSQDDICDRDDPCCGNICCEFQRTWPAVYEIESQSMSLNAYNYWEAVKKLNSNNGLVLDTYPFPLKGNVSCSNCDNETIGLFRVVSETRKKIEIAL